MCILKETILLWIMEVTSDDKADIAKNIKVYSK